MLRRFFPGHLSQWLMALVIGAVLATQALALILYHFDGMRAVAVAESRQAAQCLAGFERVLASEPPERRRVIMMPLTLGRPPGDFGPHGGPPFDFGSRPFGEHFGPGPSDRGPPPGPPPDSRFEPPNMGFGDHRPDFLIHLPLPPDRPILAAMAFPPDFGGGLFRRIEVHGHLPDGTYVTLDTVPSLGRLITPEFAAYIGGVLLIALTGSVWAIALATRPLRRLSEAADRFGADVNAHPLPETGPHEVKQAAAAFNRMQQRLRQFVSDRTRMLAAISHDLRTPLTRMRLRAEMLEDSEQRTKMLSDLEQMEEMVGAALTFARDQVVDEKSVSVDLAELLASVLADAHAAGQPVGLMQPDVLPARVRPRSFKRAVVNIVENAVRYAGSAEIAARRDGDEIEIRVVDHGPGIPESERDDVLKPFYRCESSRSRETGGIGLGLSIAADTIRAHGGRISLSDTSGGGLTVELRMPAAA
ncbi:MAG TPA: ATP-binding protein [Alphaproteobacteria bacterium]|nr:ATP-binding protein [Alphaproteobacteria bacterium]